MATTKKVISSKKALSKKELTLRNNRLAAEYLVREIPIAQMRRILGYGVGSVAKGSFCGGGCGGTSGKACGLGCRPGVGAPDVIDVEGRLGLTEREVTDLRKQLPALRKAVNAEIEMVLRQF